MVRFKVRDVEIRDKASLIDIYNKSINKKIITINTESISKDIEDRWFVEVISKKFPVKVIEYKEQIIAWFSFRRKNHNIGFHNVAEILIFIDQNFIGKKIINNIISMTLREAIRLEIKNVLVYMFKHKNSSVIISNFKKFGFEKWGMFPDVAEFDRKRHCVLVLGKKLQSPTTLLK